MGIGFQNRCTGVAFVWCIGKQGLSKPSEILGVRMSNDSKNSEKFPILICGAIAGLVVIGVWFWFGLHPVFGLSGGDNFDAVNALFSGLAFAGIILTVVLQSRELKLQRDELKETREELKGQKVQLALQAQTLRQQADDANFFRMLEIFRGMAKTMRHPGGYPDADQSEVAAMFYPLNPVIPEIKERITGMEYWRLINKICRHSLSTRARGVDELRTTWENIYRRWDTSLGSYFATLAELLDSFERVDQETAQRWANLLRAQFGLQEMLIIYYHGLTDWGQGTLKAGIEKYGLFAYMPGNEDYSGVAPRSYYQSSAFGD